MSAALLRRLEVEDFLYREAALLDDWKLKEWLALFAPEGARDLYAALAASRRGDRDAARTALEAMRSRPGWSAWLAAMSGDSRLSAVSQLLG